MVGYVQRILIRAEKPLILAGDDNFVRVWTEEEVMSLHINIIQAIEWSFCQENLSTTDVLVQLRDDINGIFEKRFKELK